MGRLRRLEGEQKQEIPPDFNLIVKKAANPEGLLAAGKQTQLSVTLQAFSSQIQANTGLTPEQIRTSIKEWSGGDKQKEAQLAYVVCLAAASLYVKWGDPKSDPFSGISEETKFNLIQNWLNAVRPIIEQNSYQEDGAARDYIQKAKGFVGAAKRGDDVHQNKPYIQSFNETVWAVERALDAAAPPARQRKQKVPFSNEETSWAFKGAEPPAMSTQPNPLYSKKIESTNTSESVQTRTITGTADPPQQALDYYLPTGNGQKQNTKDGTSVYVDNLVKAQNGEPTDPAALTNITKLFNPALFTNAFADVWNPGSPIYNSILKDSNGVVKPQFQNPNGTINYGALNAALYQYWTDLLKKGDILNADSMVNSGSFFRQYVTTITDEQRTRQSMESFSLESVNRFVGDVRFSLYEKPDLENQMRLFTNGLGQNMEAGFLARITGIVKYDRIDYLATNNFGIREWKRNEPVPAMSLSDPAQRFRTEEAAVGAATTSYIFIPWRFLNTVTLHTEATVNIWGGLGGNAPRFLSDAQLKAERDSEMDPTRTVDEVRSSRKARMPESMRPPVRGAGALDARFIANAGGKMASWLYYDLSGALDIGTGREPTFNVQNVTRVKIGGENYYYVDFLVAQPFNVKIATLGGGSQINMKPAPTNLGMFIGKTVMKKFNIEAGVKLPASAIFNPSAGINNMTVTGAVGFNLSDSMAMKATVSQTFGAPGGMMQTTNVMLEIAGVPLDLLLPRR